LIEGEEKRRSDFFEKRRLFQGKEDIPQKGFAKQIRFSSNGSCLPLVGNNTRFGLALDEEKSQDWLNQGDDRYGQLLTKSPSAIWRP
jgi:hypothetical protein